MYNRIALTAIFPFSVFGFWKVLCPSRLGLARIDPIVSPNHASIHAHIIFGGNHFNFDTTYKDLRESSCTSCLVAEDKSAYWTPPLLFLFPNLTTEVVPQVGDMEIYYLLRGENIQPFPMGFQMIAGNNSLLDLSIPIPDPPKSFWNSEDMMQEALAQKAIGFNCLHYYNGVIPEDALARHFLPDKAYLDSSCPQGLRLELLFPSCWNGKDVTSINHYSHLRYPNLVDEGTCPEGFTTRLPMLLYQTIFNTYKYRDIEGEFIFSNGDLIGSRYHGDFMSGWNVNYLKKAIAECTNVSGEVQDCPLFALQTEAQRAQARESASSCAFQLPSELQSEDCIGPRYGICGNVTVKH